MIDIVPTILEATGIPAPDTINGIRQRPVDGVSMVYTWDEANANAPSKRDTQYFEMLGNRAVYHDGWVAATTPVTIPWEMSTKTPPDVITGYNWELYNIENDFTEFNDLAAKMPDKLKEMEEIFYAEAKKFDVLPLDNSTLGRFLTPRPSATASRTSFTYSGELTGVPASAAPNILQKSYTITAEVEIPEGGAEGMIVTQGGRFGGYGLFLSKGEFGIGRSKPVFLYNLLDLKRTAWAGPELEAGKHTIVFDFKFDGGGFGKGGTGVLTVDGKEADKKHIDNTTPVMFPEDEDFDIGQDTRTPLALIEYRYDCPFKFTGKINKLTFELGPAQYTAEDRKQLPAIRRPSRPREGLAAYYRMKKLLTLAAVVEGATGVALLIAPSLVGRLLLGTELVGVSIPVARVTGIALIALGVSCFPPADRGRLDRALVGMVTYNLLVTLYLLYLGVRGEWVGPLLWPVAAVHAVLTVLLVLSLFRAARAG